MKAMVLAAGFGTRLGALTKHTAKCLIKAGDRTMLEHVIDRLKGAGVSEVVINLHHLASQVEDFVRSRGNFGLKVLFSREEIILGTGGGLKHAERFFAGEEAFIVYNADIYSDLDLSAMVDRHIREGVLATLAVLPCRTKSFLLRNPDGLLTGWINEDAGRSELRLGAEADERVTFGGIHVLSGRIFEFMRDESGEFSILEPYMKALHAGCRLLTYDVDEAGWADIGTPEQWQALDCKLKCAAAQA
jgi:N-acetyl-alpha-D-muramate 1-phosphate uridylyltransferase